MATTDELLSRIEALDAKISSAVPAKPPAPIAEESPKPEPQKEPPVYTWEELQKAVEDDKLSESAAHKMWADQTRRLAVKEATQTVEEKTRRETAERAVDLAIGKYRDLIPEVMVEGSAERNKVIREFKKLTGDYFYDKGDVRTELAALQAAFGPVDAIAKRVQNKREAHEDVPSDDGGSGDDDAPAKDKDNTPPSGLSADEKRYYENLIPRVYRNWGAVRDELKFASNRIRRKYGTKV